MTLEKDAPFTDDPLYSGADVVEIARLLLERGSIPSRNSAFASFCSPTFAKGVRLARQLRDLSTAIAAMQKRGSDAHIDENSEGCCVSTVTETRAGPVTRRSFLPPGALLLLRALIDAQQRADGPSRPASEPQRAAKQA